MKLAAGDIAAFLQAPQKKCSATLVYGPDGGLVRERVKTIGGKIVRDMADPFNVVELTEEKLLADPPLLRDELAAMSFTGDARLVIIRDGGDKLSAIITEAFEGLSSAAFLLVYADELSPRSSLRLLFEKNAQFAALACYRDEGRSLESVIRGELERHGLRPSQEALSYLLYHLGNDRGVTLSELEKLATYMGQDKNLTLEAAQQLIGGNVEHTLDGLCQAVADRDAKRLETALFRLAREGTPAIAMLRSLQKYFQRLHYLVGLMENGQSAEQAVASLRPPVFFRQVPALKCQLQQWRRASVIAALEKLLETERKAKSGLYPAETLCQRLFLELAAGKMAA